MLRWPGRKTLIDSEAVRTAVDRILAGQAFQGSGRSAALLRFLVERTLQGQGADLKEYTLGAEALGRGASFDPRTDSIARVEASRLRSRLELYYSGEGRTDALRVALPKGTYVPTFEIINLTRWTRRERLLIAAIAVSAAIVLALLQRLHSTAAPGQLTPVTRVEVNLGPSASLRSVQVGSSSVVLSPDGRRLVFVSFAKHVPQLMTMPLDDVQPVEARELPGTEGARGPFFSSDGRWIAYWAAAKLWKTSVDGGTPVALCDAEDLLGGSWGDDGNIVAAITTSGLWQIPSTGGPPVRINGIPENIGARWPHVLPGSKAVVFSAGAPANGPPRIAVFSFLDRAVKNLVVGGGHARYLASGQLAYVDRGNLFVAPFDLASLHLGTPVAVLDDVATGMYGSAEFDVSQTGALVYRRRSGGTKSIIQRIAASGAVSPLVAEPGEYAWPRLSPDGRQLSVLVGQVEQRDAVELRIIDVRSGRLLRSTVGAAYSSPVWSADGRFLVSPRPSGGINWFPADGSGQPATLIASDALQIPWSFTADGSRLAFSTRGLRPGTPGTFDLWTVRVRADAKSLTAETPEQFLVSNRFEIYPAFSPDGRWIAYTSLETGAYEIFVRAFPDSGRAWRISSGDGVVAWWSRDGRRVFFGTSARRIMVVEWDGRGAEPQFKPPRLWLDRRLADTGVSPSFDVGPDDTIAALMPVPSARTPQDDQHVTLVMNFLGELSRRTTR